MGDPLLHHDVIEAYCDRLSYVAGDTVGVCVSTTAPSYDIEIVRWGGDIEPVWRASGLTGREQPTPDDADRAGCRWEPTVTVPVDAAWRTGCYLVTLTASEGGADRRVGHAWFAVRAAVPTSPYLYVVATSTWNAYNEWGGCSLYTGGHQVSFRRPFTRGILARPDVGRDDRKARPRHTGEEPDVDGEIFQRHRLAQGYPSAIGSTGWWSFDRRFVEWAERAGYELDVAVSTDLATVDGLTDGYRCVIGAGHDEYWSAGMRSTVERFVAGGGTYATFSGNTMFWQVRFVDDDRDRPDADPGRATDPDADRAAGPDCSADHMVCHKYTAHQADPIVATEPRAATGMWSDPTVGRPESRFLGAGSMFGLYARFGQATPRGIGGFVVHRDDHWLLAGTGLRYGDVLGMDAGIVGYETVGTSLGVDDLRLPIVYPDPTLPADTLPDPADVEIVAWTPASNVGVGEYPKSIAALSDQGDLEHVAERCFGGGAAGRAKARHGNAVLLVCHPFGRDAGRVITAGSTDWVFGLDDPAVARVTRNALDAALEDPGPT